MLTTVLDTENSKMSILTFFLLLVCRLNRCTSCCERTEERMAKVKEGMESVFKKQH